MSLGTNLYALRARAGLSQDALAERLEVSRQSVSKWETDASVPELEKLIRLAEMFNVTLDELVRGDVTAAPAALAPEAPEGMEPAPEIFEWEPPEPGPEGPERPSTRPPVSHGQRVTGNALLITAAALTAALTLFLGILGLLLAGSLDLLLIPCGILCRRCPKRAGLWCAWAVWLWVDGYIVANMGISTGAFLVLFTGNPELLLGMAGKLVLSGVMLAVIAAMTAWTAWSFRRTPLSRTPGHIALAAALWAGRVGLGYAIVPIHNAIIRSNLHSLLGTVNPLLMLLQDTLTAAAVVVTVTLMVKREKE